MNKKNYFLLLLLFVLTAKTLSAQVTNNAWDSTTIKQELKEYFTTPLAEGLRKGITERKIKKIESPELRNLAMAYKNGNYEKSYRLSSYGALLDPSILGVQLHIGRGYSNYENMTGIVLDKGLCLILVDGLPEGKELTMRIPNWERRPPEGISPTKDPAGWGLKREQYVLKNGVNVVDIKQRGLAYLPYFSALPENEPDVKVHFVNGAINGYFDISKHTDEDWNRMLDSAVYPVLDARGRHIQVAYPVEAYNKYARGRGRELIANYDTLVYRQYRIMGLIKYDRVPENRILARVNYNYYMFRDGDGVAYMGGKQGYAMKKVTDPNEVAGKSTWGFCHEVGHVHQLRPYLNWTGLGEVSNNIYANYVSTSLGNNSAIHGKYNQARAACIDKGISYLQSVEYNSKLAPFWQLHLYFSQNGYSDFYPDLHEYYRSLPEVTRETRKPFVEYQLDFVRQACRIGKKDLTEFFEKWGFFAIGEWEQNDYSKGQYKLTADMVDRVKAEIKAMNLPKPKMDITLIED
ncbi:MAG: M60 family metallopeptidase [Marinifilaceae bacterium]